jgi:GntR family transcriptional repressor for pyruvate dehydrogenase complex
VSPRRGRKVAEVVAREILRDIVERGLPPGSRLPPESEMTQRYEIGRGSLREALRILEVQGLLTIRPGPGGGPVLAALSPRDFGRMCSFYFMAHGATYRDTVSSRLALEPFMARMLASRKVPEEVAALHDSLIEQEAALGATDTEWAAVGSGFHTRLAELSGNRVIMMLGLALTHIYAEHLPRARYSRIEREKILAEHGEIAEAIVGGDADRAEQLMRAHMEGMICDVNRDYSAFLDQIVDWD